MIRNSRIGAKNRAFRSSVLARALPLVALLGMSACGTAGQSAMSADPSVRLSTVFLNAGAADAALRAADDVVSRQPRSAAALEARGNALAALGRLEEAQQAYAAAISAAPSAIEPRIALGRLLVRLSPPAAEAMFTEVLALQPRNITALNNLGVARDLQGRHVEAQAAYRAALALDAAMAGAGTNLGLSLVLSGNMAEAVQTLRPLAAAPDASSTVIENLAVALAASGNAAEAERLLGRSMSPAEVDETLRAYRRTPVAPLVNLPPPAAPMAPPMAPHPVALTVSTGLLPTTARTPAAAPAMLEPPPTPVAAAQPPAAALPDVDQVAASPVRLPAVPVSAAAAPVSIAALSVPAALRESPAPAPIEPPGAAQAASPPTSAVPALPFAVPALAPMGMVSVPVAAVIAAPATASAAVSLDNAQRPAAQRPAFAQLAAIASEARAGQSWQTLRQNLGPLLRDRPKITVLAEVSGRTFWRLRTGPFQERREAEAFCAEVRAAGGRCWATTSGG